MRRANSIVLLLLLSTPAWGMDVGMSRQELVSEVQRCAAVNNLDWRFFWAVIRTETGDKHHEYRLGRIGRHKELAGPCGLHVAYVQEKYGVDVTDPITNIRHAAWVLRNTESDEAKIRRLKNYNKEWWEGNYIKDVMARYRQLCRAERGK